MNMSVRRNVVGAVLAALLVTGGTGWAIAANVPAEQTVTSGSTVEPQTVSPRAESSEHRQLEAVDMPVAAPVEPVAAPVEAAPAPVAPAPVVQAPAPAAPAPAPAPPAPAPAAIKCPAGSTANSSDGFNDTSCYPDVCFTIVVPNPSHPECDAPFRP